MSTSIAKLSPEPGFDLQQIERRVGLDVPSAARTSSGSSGVFYVGDKSTLRATLTVAARSGTSPTLDVSVMTCDTENGTYYSAGAFSQKTATGAQRACFTVDRFVRFDWALGGTSPSFTFSIGTPEAV